MECSNNYARYDWSNRVHYIPTYARALRHARALWNYNARPLRHKCARANLWTQTSGFACFVSCYFIKGIKKLVAGALLSYISTREFVRTRAKYLEKYEPPLSSI